MLYTYNINAVNDLFLFYFFPSYASNNNNYPPQQVLEGRAVGIFSDHTKGDSPNTTTLTPNASSSRSQTPVAVKVLREDATPTEQMYFLHELRPYRDLSHSNVLKVLAHCLETEPFLILMQLCPKVKATMQLYQTTGHIAEEKRRKQWKH